MLIKRLSEEFIKRLSHVYHTIIWRVYQAIITCLSNDYLKRGANDYHMFFNRLSEEFIKRLSHVYRTIIWRVCYLHPRTNEPSCLLEPKMAGLGSGFPENTRSIRISFGCCTPHTKPIKLKTVQVRFFPHISSFPGPIVICSRKLTFGVRKI